MFHTILTLSYTIPGIYIFSRILKLFIPRKHRWTYVLIFAMLFAIYPLSRSLGGRMAPLFESVSNYLLPFYLYLFLLVLLTDIILIINRLSGISIKERVTGSIRSYRYFGMLIALSFLIVIAGIINFNSIRTTTYRIKINAGKSDLKNLRVAFVSDFHLQRDVSEKFMKNFVEEINNIKPDILLYGGDIVEGAGNDIPHFEAMLNTIKCRFGVYGIMGNHDRIVNFRDNFFKRSGIVLLRDSVVTLNNSFLVAGRKISRNYRKDAGDLIQGISNLPVIMLDHIPTDFNKISSTQTDLVLSGHTHDGQLFPINLYLKNIYELSYGHLQKGNTHFIVSSGIRLWGPRVRTVGRSEIVVAEIDLITHP